MPFCHLTLIGSRPLPPVYPREMRTIGDHLRKKRLDLGLLQKEVAQRLGVDTDSVTNWEKGYSSPLLRLIPKVIQFLGYIPGDLQGLPLGERIVAIRRTLGIRQEDLARELGVDATTLARWETEKVDPLPRHSIRVNELLDSRLRGFARLHHVDGERQSCITSDRKPPSIRPSARSA